MAAEPTAADRLVGGRYALRQVLGRGGMGVVWLATDEKLQRPVAVKEVTFALHLSEQERRVLRERTLREARTAARLDHPCVTAVYDVVEEDGRPWLIMEHVESCSLQQIVDQQGPLPWSAVARIALDVLAGLEAAHRAGIVHRDVKPANVLVSPDGRACLTDFGIATATGDPTITTTGAIIGSPSYMAPERANGEQPQPPVDLWSLGATLYTAVEGRLAFSRGEPMATLLAVVSDEPAPMERAGPLEPVLRGLLTKDPAARMTADQARGYLEQALAGAGVAPAWSPPTRDAKAAPRTTDDGSRVARFDAADLRALASASASALGSVAREQARHLRDRRRDRRSPEAVDARPAAPEHPPQRVVEATPYRRRFKRRWVVVPVLLAVLLTIAAIGGLVALAAFLLGWL
ncbi:MULTISPECIES: serine/threonine-protein kinase [unclassified Geodermatophilus]|uniref:serine/threonine-protein kinase n=1 Tax=unclassified Geodermatophilus TaxID=2637632 RepID=UPI003EEFF51D